MLARTATHEWSLKSARENDLKLNFQLSLLIYSSSSFMYLFAVLFHTLCAAHLTQDTVPRRRRSRCVRTPCPFLLLRCWRCPMRNRCLVPHAGASSLSCWRCEC